MQVAVIGDDSEALLSLHDWLMDDVDVVRSATVGLRSTPKPGDMGAVEIISLVLSTSIGLAIFAVSLATWQRTRPESKITILVQQIHLTLQGDPPGEVAQQIIETFSHKLEDGTAEGGDE